MFSVIAMRGTSGFFLENSALSGGTASDNFTRTFISPTDDDVWTLCGEFKRSNLTTQQILWYNRRASGQAFGVQFHSTGQIRVFHGTGLRTSNAEFNDPHGYYQIVVIKNGGAPDVWVNGVEVTWVSDTGTWTGTDNWNNIASTPGAHAIGVDNNSPGSPYIGYMGRNIFVDGQNLTAEDFGEFDDEGYWNLKTYEGTYGNNGFKLDFSNNSDLGEDSSGNGNDWTKNGTITQVTDVPNDKASAGLGNFATWNPLDTSDTNWTFSNGNRKAARSATTDMVCATLIVDTTELKYWEIECDDDTAGQMMLGVVDNSIATAKNIDGSRLDTLTGGYAVLAGDGSIYRNGSDSSINLSTGAYTDGARLMFACNNGAVWMGEDGTWGNTDGSSNSATVLAEIIAGTTTNAVFTGLTDILIAGGSVSGSIRQIDFSLFCNPDDWQESNPTGSISVATQNMPAVADGDLSKHWSTTLYTGNGVAIGSGGNSITGVGFQPDFAWIKGRSGATNNAVTDAVRGATKRIDTNLTVAEATNVEFLNSFDADGFTVGSNANFNTSSATYVAWCASLPNVVTSGWAGSPTITPSKEIYNATLGMSIIQYVGNLTSGATFAHSGLGNGSTPFMVVVKETSGTGSWIVGHDAIGFTKYLVLNSTAAASTLTAIWNDTAPTSQLITLGNNIDVNTSGATYIAYLFYETDFIKPISYTGNGNADGAFDNLGISPEWSMIKRSSSGTSSWVIHDSARDVDNPNVLELLPNSSAAEATDTTTQLDSVSNGLKMRGTGGDTNSSGGTFVGLAIGTPTQGGSKAKSQSRGR